MRNKILSLLVLLLTAATGAWAQSNGTYSDLRAEIGSGGYITLSHDYYKYESGDPIEINTSGVIDGKGAIIDMEGANIPHVFSIIANNVTIKNLSIINYTGTGDAIYFSRSGGSVYNIGYDVALNRVTTANTWTLSMPASDVLLTPQYATVAKWAVESAGTTEEKTLLPAAAEGVIAGTDAPLIAEGTGIVAFAGTSTEDTQGTVMYAVTETKTSVPALADFRATVPTAAEYDDAKTVYVWYYIEGIEPENFADRTAQNTFDNSDICTEPLEVSVLTNKFTLTLDPAPVEKVTVTIDNATEPATPDANGKIANIKMGSEVKIKANTGYKLRKVEVKKTEKYMKWDAAQKKLVATEIPATATKVENYNRDDSWSAGTYLVEGDVTIDGYIHLYGDVELIIKDGAKLTAHMIDGFSNYSLSIYGQTKMSGELNIACGGEAICNMTALNIHSCKVNAISSNSRYCGGFYNITEVNVYGGSVDAEYTGGSDGYGISPTTMNIYGGEVKAVGKGNDNSFSYGIRGDGTVNVYGGKLWAECAGNRAINSNVTLTKGEGFNGKIETGDNGTSWNEYSGTGTPGDKYVRVGY